MRHKRKLEALVNLTMQMSFAGDSKAARNEKLRRSPPDKTFKALGTQPVGLRLSLGGSAPSDTFASGP